MTMRPPTTETRIVLRTAIFRAGVLAVLLACAGTAAGATWVVDDDGGADFTSIQAAVDAASAGDTIEVWSGTYVENVYVNKQLTLRGIDTGAGMPVVDAGGSGSVISLSADGITLSGFMVTGKSRTSGTGIGLHGNYCNISNNNISDIEKGIYLYYVSSNILTNNKVFDTTFGIWMRYSRDNIVTSNNISNNMIGINLIDSNSNTLKNNIISKNSDGLNIQHSSSNTLIENKVSKNGDGILILSSKDNVLIINNISNNVHGIFMYVSTNNTLINNEASKNDYGIYIFHSSANTLVGNLMTGNQYNFGLDGKIDSHFDNDIDTTNLVDGKIVYYVKGASGMIFDSTTTANAGMIYCIQCDNILIKDITLTHNYAGVYFWNTNNSKIENVKTSNNEYGIHIVQSNANILVDNLMSGNCYNFGLDGKIDSHFDNSIDTTNLVDGKIVYYIKGASAMTFDGTANAGMIYCIQCDNILIKDITLTNNYAGIYFWKTNNSKIESVKTSNNEYGINLHNSNNNILEDNRATNNHAYGINLLYSNNNTLKDNIASNNSWGSYPWLLGLNKRYGINLVYSNSNKIMNNIATKNLRGIVLDSSNYNKITNNTVWSNAYNGITNTNIYLKSSSNNLLINNDVFGNIDGFTVYGFRFSLNSDNNTITNNNVANHFYGIHLDSSVNNSLYYNNLIENRIYDARDNSDTNQWDSGTEGNYYSDYTGTDSNNDGIGDTPYPIPGGSSEDRYPLMVPYTPPTGPQNKSLVQVEGQPEVYWFQNGMLYWVTDWNVINDMSGVPGWDHVNTLPASEFDPATYPQGPRFITTGAESNDLLIREQGGIKVYLILNGEKHHFTSPEELTWNGYGFDDVVEVSSSIIGMFPEGTPISIQEKHLLRKPGGTHVFWSQNGELYYVTADALDKMLDIPGWGWDEINEPADFNPEDPSHYKTFITTDPESNGVLIRLWDGYKVYRIEDGFRRHITYPEVMELKGYAMEDVIDVSQEIIDMFPLGDPIGIEVNLTFNKTTDSGEEPCTKFTTGETVRFYTETTVSESYTVDTYVKLTEPDGRTRYAYHTDPDFQPTDPLSFSDTEVPLYPGHWDAVSKNWNWHEYTFNDDEEGVYTWEFYYKDVISENVLGWDRKAYSFNKKTELEIKLDIETNKYKYNKNGHIIIAADVYNDDGPISADDFRVTIDQIPQDPQKIKFNPTEPGKYEITGVYAPSSSGNHQIDVRVSTDAGNSDDSTFIYVRENAIYNVLMILACPDNLYNPDTKQPNVDDWYQANGYPSWYKDVADEVEGYYCRISYGKAVLDITTTDEWIKLSGNDASYPNRVEGWYKDAKTAAKEYNSAYDSSKYDLVIVADPDYVGGMTGSSCDENMNACKITYCRVFTPFKENDPFLVMVRVVGHELTHCIDTIDDHKVAITNNPPHGDNIEDDGFSIMGGIMLHVYDWWPFTMVYEAPFDPINAKKMGFSNYDGIGAWYMIHRTLHPIEEGRDRAIGIKMDKNDIEYNYWIEFRDGTWPNEREDRAVLIWKSKDDIPYSEAGPNWDHPHLAEKITSDLSGWGILDWNLYHDSETGLELRVTKITDDYANIEVKSASDVFTTVQNVSGNNYSIEMQIIGNFFTNCTYYFSVIDTTDQSEVFNSTLTTNPEGFFDSPITFNATITDNIEAHPYLIRVHTVSGWVPFLIATPSLIDGISNETPTFTASDPTETNTAGDLTNLTSTCGSMKLSLKTAVPVDTDSYRYVIYLDSDNSSSTGSIVNSIGADYKIEYSGAVAGLYKYNTSWTLVDTPYLNASHNGTNIEILTTTEIMNGTDTVKLVAQTFDSSDTLHDTLPDPTATPPYLEFMDVHPMDLRFAEYGYYAGDNVTVNGYGFAQNQMIPITIMNQTGHALWNGNVQADSDGQVINISTYTVPDDFYGTAYLYWAGAQMDSFSMLTPSLPVYNAEFELDAPMVAGVGRAFNVTVGFENIGDDLTNLTLNLNTSGMTSEPDTVWIGDLTSGQNYTYTWNLTPTCSGFALLKSEVCSNQSTFVTDQTGIYIANISVEIDAPNGAQCGSIVEFNVSVTNNQENITYTDLGINTSIKEIETNFTQQVIALPSGQTVNQSYLWDTANVTPGTYQIMVDIVSNGVVLSSGESSILVNFTPVDTTPPSSITHLHPNPASTHINWTWTNPSDPDFNHTKIYLNGAFQTLTSAEFFNATGLIPNTEYEISTRTADNLGNINETWVNDTTMTLDTPPVSNASGPYTGIEGQAIIFNASASYDPDPGDNIVSFEWDFNNDGATDATGMEVSWTWNDDYAGQVNLTVTDSHGESSTDTTSVNVLNAPPEVEAGNDQTVNEGDTVSFIGDFTDPGTGDTHTIEWNFGDGTPGSTGTLEPTHVYADNGTYTVTLTVTDDNAASTLDILNVTVENVAPIVDAGEDQIANEGDIVSFAGSFTDPGTADTHLIEWDFGDGTQISSGTLTPTHTYADNGTYVVNLTVTDDDGASTSDTLIVTVNNVAPVLDECADQTVQWGYTMTFSRSFTDPGDDYWTAEIDWGDGSQEEGILSSKIITATHVYSIPGEYICNLTVRDDDGGVGSGDMQITVTTRATELEYIGDLSAQYSDYINLKVQLNDPGNNNPLPDRSISFILGTQTATATTGSDGIATTSFKLDQPAGSYDIKAEFAGDDSYSPDSDTKVMQISKEDTEITYTGDTILPTTAGSIDLRATLEEIDTDYGDLTEINVNFNIYKSSDLSYSNPVATVPSVASISVTSSGMGVGTATATIDNLTEDDYMVIARIVPNDYYLPISSKPTPMIVYEPTDQFTTGGGWIWDPTGSHGNFGFNVKYNKKGKVKGNSIYVYRLDGLDYIVKSNAWIGLAISDNTSTFQGKAVLQIFDPVTGELQPESSGNFQFTVEAMDNELNGNPDYYKITVLDKDGLEYHNATGSLNGGNIVIHDKKSK